MLGPANWESSPSSTLASLCCGTCPGDGRATSSLTPRLVSLSKQNVAHEDMVEVPEAPRAEGRAEARGCGQRRGRQPPQDSRIQLTGQEGPQTSVPGHLLPGEQRAGWRAVVGLGHSPRARCRGGGPSPAPQRVCRPLPGHCRGGGWRAMGALSTGAFAARSCEKPPQKQREGLAQRPPSPQELLDVSGSALQYLRGSSSWSLDPVTNSG